MSSRDCTQQDVKVGASRRQRIAMRKSSQMCHACLYLARDITIGDAANTAGSHETSPITYWPELPSREAQPACASTLIPLPAFTNRWHPLIIREREAAMVALLHRTSREKISHYI